MKKSVLIMVCLFLDLILVPYAWSDVNIREGNWQFSVVADKMDDGPGNNSPRVFSCCLSRDRQIPVDPSVPENCEYTDPRMEGKQVTYTRVCHGKNGRVSETTVELVFTGGKMDGYLYTIIDDPKEGVSDLTEYMTGEFQGSCSAAN